MITKWQLACVNILHFCSEVLKIFRRILIPVLDLLLSKCEFVNSLSYTTAIIEMVDHKFLKLGTLKLQCNIDRSHWKEKEKKNFNNSPSSWLVSVCMICGIFKALTVFEMKQHKFKDFVLAVKTKCSFRKQSEENEAFTDFGKVLFKSSLKMDEPLKTLNILKRCFSLINIKDILLC